MNKQRLLACLAALAAVILLLAACGRVRPDEPLVSSTPPHYNEPPPYAPLPPTPSPTPTPAPAPTLPLTPPSNITTGPATGFIGNISMTINGQQVVFPDGESAVTAMNNNPLIPLRIVFEALGFTVAWDATTRAAIITNPTYEIHVNAGSYFFTVNGITHVLPTPAQSINGRVFAPMQILNSIGASTQWNMAFRTITLTA